MGAFPGTVSAFGSTPYGLTNYGPWPPVFMAQTPPLAAAAANLGTLTVPAVNTLWIDISITGFSGSDSAGIRFNGDTGTNYVARYITAAAGGVVFADAPFVSGTSLRLSAAAGTTGLHVSMRINNFATVSKQCLIGTHLTTGAAATAPTAVIAGSGEWVNTTAQITTIQALVVGANNFNAGSSITIWGTN